MHHKRLMMDRLPPVSPSRARVEWFMPRIWGVRRKIKSSTNCRGAGIHTIDYVIRRFNASSAELKNARGAGPSLGHRLARSPGPTGTQANRSRAGLQAPREDGSPVSCGTGLQLMQFNNPASTKNENKKNDLDAKALFPEGLNVKKANSY
jgi:hypothetical protein